MEIVINREKNLLIMPRPLKVYIDGVFIDYIEPFETIKKVNTKNTSSELYIKINNCYSNKVVLDKEINKVRFNVTSQVQNGLFILIASCFILGWVLLIFDIINIYLSMAMVSTLAIIVFWQTIGSKNYLRLTRVE
ncbi:hypothetical protein [uncultured Tenacibaculum sp.]|uniref:hypothetical protein n=1 Tax=uncultured Tenacibaculum sp. TaxID=174713 RepID=UPI00261F2C3D|nr:hypothetical protein [uncultured Tenacibaculum sp.]